MTFQLLYTDKKDSFYDYCHYAYSPLTGTGGLKLKSFNLLLDSFKQKNCSYIFYDLVQKIQNSIGADNTVYGIKKYKNKISWEFYFYNYGRENSKITVSNIIRTIKPFVVFKGKWNENLPYFMFSINISLDILKNGLLPAFRIYITGQSDRRTGLSYLFDGKELKFENHYAFYDPKTEINELVEKIKSSVFIDFSKIGLNAILLPELILCKTICIANKKGSDCIYYSGIDINQFLFFLKEFGFPRGTVDFIEKHKAKLDHMQYDVGFDYKMKKNELKITKSHYYGTF